MLEAIGRAKLKSGHRPSKNKELKKMLKVTNLHASVDGKEILKGSVFFMRLLSKVSLKKSYFFFYDF